jgi:hypothetical protein
MPALNRERLFVLAIYSTACHICKSTGLIQFTQEGRTYPNTPCPACRYRDLKRWLRRWCLDPNIAPWLWKHYKPLIPRSQRSVIRHMHKHHKAGPEDVTKYLKP